MNILRPERLYSVDCADFTLSKTELKSWALMGVYSSEPFANPVS